MKKNLLLLGVLPFSFLQAQDCSELFISEYLEGLGNNKALEIYNPTNQTIDLTGYFVVRYNNGNGDVTLQSAEQLKGTIAPHGVHVGVLDKRDPNGQGQEGPIWEDLEAKADAFYSKVYDEKNVFYWNGDDAVALMKGTIDPSLPITFPLNSLTNVQVLDLFGKIGENPGADGWGYEGVPVANGGSIATKDHFLVRKSSVKKGVKTNPTTFNPSLEWDTLSFFTYIFDENGDTVYNSQNQPARRMNVDNLGIHDCDCNELSVKDGAKLAAFDFQVYPNPVTNKEVNFITTADIREITIYNSLGQVVKHISDNTKMLMTIPLDVHSGVYFMSAQGANGLKITKKFIVK